jgi:CBS domain-containing protein
MLSATEIYFRDLFRQERLVAYQDAEGFQGILFALEKFGACRANRILNLGQYKNPISEIARRSPLYSDIPNKWREYHLPFDRLYELVRNARNDALHQGAYARHLTDHAVQLSLIIEDALMEHASLISDYMVRGVISAELWQPLSFVRQQMLANSFSYLPLLIGHNWRLLSDGSIAKYIQTNRKELLARTVEEAVKDSLQLEPAQCCNPDTPAADAVRIFSGKPLLVVDKKDNEILIGIITAFDLL